MSIELLVSPLFSEDWTSITITGEDEESILNILVSRLLICEYDIQIEDEDGNLIPPEEY